jgi:hypothetical protein
LVRQPAERARLQLARTLGVSPRRLHGWAPLTTQRGYDRDGNQVLLAEAWEIVTETEPEWSDDDRMRLLALAQYEAGVHECGFHWSLLEDKSNVFMPEMKVCPVCRGATRFAHPEQGR